MISESLKINTTLTELDLDGQISYEFEEELGI